MRARLRESAALAHQGWLIASEPFRSAVPRRPEAPVLVVFVHGFMANSAVLDPLQRAVAADLRLDTLGFDYDPVRSFQKTANRLAQVCRLTRNERPLALIGHSLGGLICRQVAELQGVQTSRLITMATPHRGTQKAEGKPGSLARSLSPGSEVLRRLGPRSSIANHTAIVADDDTLIVPIESAAAEGATVHRLKKVGHNGLLYDPRMTDIVQGVMQRWLKSIT